MNRAIDNVIKKGKALKGSADKLRGVKKQADALRGRMLKEDKGRLGKALSKPSVTDKRSRDYGGRLTKGARGQDPATGGKKGNAKPAAAKRKSAPKDGTDITREIGRAKGNKRISNLNKQIKEAGTNAAGLRLEKLKVQTRMPNKPRQRVQPTAKQSAKEASRNDAIRKRSAELRAQSGRVNRAYANQARTADTRNKPGSSMIRRPSRKTTRGAIRAEQALKFYRDPKGALKSVNKKRPGFRMPRGMRK